MADADTNPKPGKKRRRSTVDKLLLGAVVGAAIGSVVGASLSSKSKKGRQEAEKAPNEFDKIKEIGDDKAKSWLRRLRLYLKRRNERKRLRRKR